MAAHKVLEESVWTATANMPGEHSLSRDLRAEVCIVGGGIAGLSTAYFLSLQGRRVVVLDDGPLGGGQTQVTTAHLSNELDDRYVEIERLHGSEGARLAAESHTAAIDRIEQAILAENIVCDFERLDGYLFAADASHAELLEQEFAAAHRTGVVAVERAGRAPLTSFDTGPCLRFPRQAQFHPLKYLAGLVRAIKQNGGQLYTSTHATHIEGGPEAHVTTAAGPVVRADSIVVATNTPINDMVAIHTKQAPYMSYVVGLKVQRGAVPRALYWDTHDPYHYVRLQTVQDVGAAPQDILIVGGEDHKTGQADDGAERFARLEAWARERFAGLGEVEYRWAGQVMEPVDGLAFIGRNPMDKDNVYIVTGDSGMGMTHGTIAGLLLTDLITGRENPWTNLYDPSRKTVRSAGEFARENLNVAGCYASWVTPGEVTAPEDVLPGTGAVMRRGLTKVAIYRDEQGSCHELSAVCPHLGCIVAWNSVERTWDCPCHGSRFSAHGHVLNGPANINLKIRDESE